MTHTTHEVANGAGGFFPAGFETPSGGGGRYFKPQDGENKLRILTKPILGWKGWSKTGGSTTPLLARYDDTERVEEIRKTAAKNKDANDRKIKFFISMVVYDYATEQQKIWEVTQVSIIDALNALSNDEEWGDPSDPQNGYGLKVTRSGSGMDTKYAVMPGKAMPAKPEMLEGLDKINLDALFDGGNPFEDGDDNSASAPTGDADGEEEIPF